MPQIIIYVDEDLDKVLKSKSRELGVSKSDVITRILKAGLNIIKKDGEKISTQA